MRNAALVLGIFGGVIAILIGFFSYGWTELQANYDVPIGRNFDDPQLIRLASFFAPILAIAGGSMARIRALWAGILLIVATALIYGAFGFNVFTMFPIGMCGLAAILALAAGRPDEPRSHF